MPDSELSVFPKKLAYALKPITIVAGHYGVGKTNVSVNLAIDLVAQGKQVTLVDLDIVNPYFRATEQRVVLEEHGVSLVAPVFAEAGSSLDVPSLTGRITPALEMADENRYVVVDLGGDDVGATAMGRFARFAPEGSYAMLAVMNRYRNLVQDPADALENLAEIEVASRLHATALLSNAHLKSETTAETIIAGYEYALEVSHMSGLPLVGVTAPAHLIDSERAKIESFAENDLLYETKLYVRSPWE